MIFVCRTVSGASRLSVYLLVVLRAFTFGGSGWAGGCTWRCSLWRSNVAFETTFVNSNSTFI